MLQLFMKEEMVENKDYELNDIVEMRKPHPCVSKSKQFEIIRLGADIKIKCLGCDAVVMMERHDFERKCKKLIEKAAE